MSNDDQLTRDDLLNWQGRARQVVMNVILSSYKVRGFNDIAPIPMDELEGGLTDFLADITINAWHALDPEAEKDDRSDEKYEDWRDARGQVLR